MSAAETELVDVEMPPAVSARLAREQHAALVRALSEIAAGSDLTMAQATLVRALLGAIPTMAGVGTARQLDKLEQAMAAVQTAIPKPAAKLREALDLLRGLVAQRRATLAYYDDRRAEHEASQPQEVRCDHCGAWRTVKPPQALAKEADTAARAARIRARAEELAVARDERARR